MTNTNNNTIVMGLPPMKMLPKMAKTETTK